MKLLAMRPADKTWPGRRLKRFRPRPAVATAAAGLAVASLIWAFGPMMG